MYWEFTSGQNIDVINNGLNYTLKPAGTLPCQVEVEVVGTL